MLKAFDECLENLIPKQYQQLSDFLYQLNFYLHHKLIIFSQVLNFQKQLPNVKEFTIFYLIFLILQIIWGSSKINKVRLVGYRNSRTNATEFQDQHLFQYTINLKNMEILRVLTILFRINQNLWMISLSSDMHYI